MLRKLMKFIKTLVVMGLAMAFVWLCMEYKWVLLATICAAIIAAQSSGI